MALEQDRKYPGKHNKPCLCPGLKATVKIQPPNTWQLLLMIKLWGHHRATLGKMLFGSVSLPLTHCLCLFIPSFCTSVIKKKGANTTTSNKQTYQHLCFSLYNISKKPPQNWLRCTAHRNDKRREQLCHSEADLICHPCTWFSGLWEKPVSLKVITHQVFSFSHFEPPKTPFTSHSTQNGCIIMHANISTFSHMKHMCRRVLGLGHR